jgi:acyl-lipid omega-6 desaturase (Delta-12 desaturase)
VLEGCNPRRFFQAFGRWSLLKGWLFLTISTQSWASRLGPYRQPDDSRAIFETILTLSIFAVCWAAMYGLTFVSWWLAALAAFPAAGFMVRVFMLQHDCGHLSMFTSRKANDWVGRCLGVITFTPYDYWRHSHAMHHAGSANLDRRGMGDISTLTIAEYAALGFWGRLGYRLYRNPFVMFGVGPIYLFVFSHRLPLDSFKQGKASWLSVLGTNLGIIAAAGFLIYFIGIWAFLLVHLPIVIVGAAAGVWLFYVQHQFDETHWERSADWSHEKGALHGSSYYDLPKPLMWLTGNIGIHHLHHLSSRIPFYRLPQVLKDFPELKDVGHLTVWESLKCVRLTLWDEAARKLVSFREARALMSARLVAAE